MKKKDDPKAAAGMREKIGAMSPAQRGKDLETEWQGKQPSSGYREEYDPAFAADATASADGKVPADDKSADYMGPDQGPFECQNCAYFIADGQPCQKVSDPIEAEGCCDLYSPGGKETQEEEHTEGLQSAGAGEPRGGAGAY